MTQILLWFLMKRGLCKFTFIISDFSTLLILEPSANFSQIR